MIDFHREFCTKSLNKVIYLATEGLDYRTVIEENELIFVFEKSEKSSVISNNYNRILKGEEISVNLTKYMQVSREINNVIREYRKRK